MAIDKTFYVNEIPEKYLNRSALQETPGQHDDETLCANCERAMRGRCPWREEGKPYPGWTAIRRDMVLSSGNSVVSVESYYVRACPGFVRSRERIEIITPAKRRGWKEKSQVFTVRAIKAKPEHLDDEGCIRLMQAAMGRAWKDYILASPVESGDTDERKQIEVWLRRCVWLSNPKAIIEKLRKHASVYDKHPEVKRTLKRPLASKEEQKLMESAYRAEGQRAPHEIRTHSGKWNVFNHGTDLEFAECSCCGFEQTNKPYPRLCPECGALMARQEMVE